MEKPRIPEPKLEDWNVVGLLEGEKLFCVSLRNPDLFNQHDRLINSGYKFVGIKRSEDDETDRKVKQYRLQERQLESLSISKVLKDEWQSSSEQIVDGVEAYFVR